MRMQNTPRYYPPRAPLWQGLLYLGLLCALFYAALNYYSGNAANAIEDLQMVPAAGQRLSEAALGRLLALRALFTLLFCLLLGFMGYRATRRLWPAAAVHTGAVVFMLWQDVPQALLLDNVPLVLALAGAVALLTLAGSVCTAWSGKAMLRRGRR